MNEQSTVNFEALQAVILGQGGTLVVLLAWLWHTLKEVRRLQKLCNRRMEDYMDLLTECSGVKAPRRRPMDNDDMEDATGA